MANLALKKNTVSAFDQLTTTTEGAIYFAIDSAENVSGTNRQRAYIYYDDGTNKLNIVPRLLGIKNGGTGLDMSTKTANSVVILNSSVNGMTTIASAKGAFYSTGTNVLPQFGTLPVQCGGTGYSSLTAFSLLVGAGTASVKLISARDKGLVLMSNGTTAVPIYGAMDMRWEPGSSAGPKFVYITNGVENICDAIPAANGTTASGIITTSSQTIGGEKTFTSSMFASNLYPRTTKIYNLGSVNYIWNSLYHKRDYWYDDSGIQNGHTGYTSGGASATEGSYGKQGYFDLHLGNSTAISSSLNQGAGNATGRLFIYGTGSGYSYFHADNTSSTNYSIGIPPASGNMLISQGESVDSMTGVYVPLSSTLNKTVKYNYALHFNHNAGSSSAAGSSEFVVGYKAETKNSLTYYNTKGILTLYNGSSGYVQIMPGTVSTSSYILYLPGATGQLVYHTNDTLIGSGTNPVYVTAAGKVTASSSTVGANNAISATGKTDGSFTPIYLNAGTITAASTTIGTTAIPLYMNAGTLTSCSPGDVFSDFSSTAGTTAGETLSITTATQTRTVTLDAATNAQSGVVTTDSQEFAGAKTFKNTTDSTSTSTGAVIVSGGVGIAKQLRVGSTATFSGVVNAYGGSVKIGTSGESATLSYDTSTDTLTISFP